MPVKNIPVPVPPGHKYCFKCESVLEHSEFHVNNSAPDGLFPSCKSCRKAQAKRRREYQKEMRQAAERTSAANPAGPEYEPEEVRPFLEPLPTERNMKALKRIEHTRRKLGIENWPPPICDRSPVRGFSILDEGRKPRITAKCQRLSEA